MTTMTTDRTPADTPADVLRAAAKLIRDTASAVTSRAPWMPDQDVPTVVSADITRPWGPMEVAETDSPETAAWIALACPALAEPLAAWLEMTASGWDRDPHWFRRVTAHPSLAVANVILGTDQ